MRSLAVLLALASIAATTLLSSGCSLFVILARETRGTGEDGPIVVGQTVSGDTGGGVDAVTPGCGSQPGSPERRYFFTAPETRRYLATTASSFDGVLAVYLHGATGEPILCNDDYGSTGASQVGFDAQAGQTYDLVVDGYHGSRGSFTLVVEADPAAAPPVVTTTPVALASGAALTVGVPVTGSTAGGTDTRVLSCGAPTAGTPDVTYAFTPPEAGVYIFRTQTDYDGTLEVFDGASSLGCNDDDGSTRASRVTTTLQGGRTYAVVLDGFGSQAGGFQLVVDHPIAQAAAGGALAVGTPVRGTTVGAPDTVTLSCGAPRPGTPDVTFTFVPPEDGVYAFRTQTDYDGTLEVFEGTTSLGCNDDDGSTRASRVTTTLVAGRSYSVVIDGYAGGMGSYELMATHPITRPAGPIQVGQTVNGSTLSGTDVRTPPCGSAPGTPEQIWTFSPPTTATYRIRVDSSYDGVLAVYPVGAPDPLMCNDDAGSTRASEIEGSLIGGQRYEIVVDGYAGGVGDYSLRLEMLSGVGGAPVTPPSAIRPSTQGGPLPENLTELDARWSAAQVLGVGHSPGIDEPPEGAAQVSCGSGGAGGDQVFTLTLTELSLVTLHVAADFAVAMELRASCTSRIERCEVAQPPTGRDLELQLAAGTYTIVLDAMESGSRGPVYLDVNVRTPTPTPPSSAQPGPAAPAP